MWSLLYQLASPRTFYAWAGRLLPWLLGLAGVFLVYGVVAGLGFAPPDYQQGEAFRIIYVHVPSAFMSLGLYAFMGFCAILVLVWQIKLADVMIKATAGLGACLTFLALLTGAIWGKPMWGTWWIWDARLTSELILLFIYLAVIALRSSIRDPQVAAKAVAVFVLIGLVDIPIIHYSVEWWHTLHQGATIAKFAKPSIEMSMLYPLLSMITGFACYAAAMILFRARSEVLWRERKTAWVAAVVKA